jgi:hypothetical protein
MTSQTAQCIDPSGIRAEDLVAYAWGEAATPIVDHIAQCQSCRSEARTLSRLDAALSARLFRRSCPDSIVIGEYAMDMLAADQRWHVAQHLTECAYCLAESRDLSAFLVATEPVPDRQGVGIQSLRRIFAEPFVAPSFAGLRGGGENESKTYVAGSLRLTVSVQRGARGTSGNVLVGLLEQEPNAKPGARAELFQGADVVQAEDVDDFGNFLFSNIPVGEYRIEVTVPTAIVVIEPVQVQ